MEASQLPLGLTENQGSMEVARESPLTQLPRKCPERSWKLLGELPLKSN